MLPPAGGAVHHKRAASAATAAGSDTMSPRILTRRSPRESRVTWASQAHTISEPAQPRRGEAPAMKSPAPALGPRAAFLGTTPSSSDEIGRSVDGETDDHRGNPE